MFIFVVASAVVLVVVLLLIINKDKRIVLSNVSEFLCLLNENKIFPLTTNDKWQLEQISHGVRTWSRTLVSDFQKASLEVSASFSLIHKPFKTVEGSLKNHKSKGKWNTNVPVDCRFRIRGSSGGRGYDVASSMESEGFNRDLVCLDMIGSGPVEGRWLARMKGWVMVVLRSIVRANNFERCWKNASDREFWLLECSSDFKSFVLYLLNSVQDNEDSCLLTILAKKNSSLLWNFPEVIRSLHPLSHTTDQPSLLLAGLNDHLMHNEVDSNQMLRSIDEAETEAPPTDTHSYFGFFNSTLTRRKNTSNKPEETSEISIFQKIKNMLEEKKTDSETSRSRRWSLLSGDGQVQETKKDNDSPINPIDIIKRFSISGKFFDDKKTESESLDVKNFPQLKDVRKKWAVVPETGGKMSDDKSGKKFLHKTVASSSSSPSEIASDIDADLLQCLETMIDNAALDIIAEKCKVANLDIKAKSEEQAVQAGGWIYCGLEKDTVILKKVSNESPVPLHSYIGKGMVSHPPKLVYEVLRCPTSRVAYDDMVKNVEILRELEGGMKIVRLLYEVGQHFKREVREFILLQGERIEGMKHVITLQSVDWNALSPSLNLPEAQPTDSAMPISMLNSSSRRNSLDLTKGKTTSPPLVGVKEGRKVAKVTKQQQLIEGLVPAKMFSSGWIIEPVLKANKLCSMITYISQMKLDTGMRTGLSYLAEDIALKQPLCIVHLRHYLATLDVEDELLAVNSDVDCKKGGTSVTLSIANALARFRNQPSVEKLEETEHDIVV